MSKTLLEISSILNSLNAEVSIHRSTYSYTSDDERWSCFILVATGGTELKVREVDESLSAALAKAFTKIEPLLQTPAVATALAIPLLPAPVIEGEVLSSDEPGF